MTHEQTAEIIATLNQLPPDKVTEVRDFALFLKERFGNPANGAMANMETTGTLLSDAERRAKTPELLAWSRAHSITLPPGSPTSVDLIREDRDR